MGSIALKNTLLPYMQKQYRANHTALRDATEHFQYGGLVVVNMNRLSHACNEGLNPQSVSE